MGLSDRPEQQQQQQPDGTMLHCGESKKGLLTRLMPTVASDIYDTPSDEPVCVLIPSWGPLFCFRKDSHYTHMYLMSSSLLCTPNVPQTPLPPPRKEKKRKNKNKKEIQTIFQPKRGVRQEMLAVHCVSSAWPLATQPSLTGPDIWIGRASCQTAYSGIWRLRRPQIMAPVACAGPSCCVTATCRTFQHRAH